MSKDNNFFDYMEKGIESEVLPIIKERIVNRMVEEFRERVEEVLSDELAKLSFDLHGQLVMSQGGMMEELRVIIKDSREYVTGYTMQREVVKKPDSQKL